MMKTLHSYHIVTVSPWPLLVGGNVIVGIVGMIQVFAGLGESVLLLGL